MADKKTIRPAVAYMLLTLCAALWGSNIAVGRYIHADFSAETLAFYRNGIALTFMLLFIRSTWRQLWPTLKTHWAIIVPAGLIGTALFNFNLYSALQTTTAVNGAVAMSLTPAVVPIIAYFMLGDRFAARQALGVVVSFIGVGIVLIRGDLNVLASLDLTIGDLMAISAMICWSYYSVLVKKRPDTVCPNLFLACLLTCAVGALLPFFIWQAVTSTILPTNTMNLFAAAYIGLFPTLIALVLFNRSIDSVGPSAAGHFQHLVPVFAATLGILFLGETLHAYHGAGATLIAMGIYCANSSAKTK